MKRLLISVLLLAGCGQSVSQVADHPPAPDRVMSPGDVCTIDDPDFREWRWGVALCTRNVSRETKTQIYIAYGVDLSTRTEYKIDHIIPISMGGSNSVRNLWPQHKSIDTQELEGEMYNKVSAEYITPQEAWAIIIKAKFGGEE